MNVVLNQDRLNGTNKKGTNIFYWRGQFNLDFVQYILDKFAKDSSDVCDPFCGSGTVLYECAKRNIRCIGMDINPSAYYISKFFSYSNICESDRKKLVKSVKKNIESVLAHEKVTFEGFVREIKKITSKEEMAFVVNIILVASRSKNLYKDTKKEIDKAFRYLGNQVVDLPISDNLIDVYLKDARELAKNELKNKFDLIFTSPPYINVFNYHQNYRKAIELLGWNVLDIAQSEIGSNRKNRGNRFKTVVQYCSDMLLTLEGFWNALREDGLVILVLGKTSSVRGIEFYNGAIIKNIIEEMKIFNIEECYERSFINKFGKQIYEDIIICRKSSNLPYDKNIDQKVALKHLKKSLNNLQITDEIYSSIQRAIDEIQIIEPSPVLKIRRM